MHCSGVVISYSAILSPDNVDEAHVAGQLQRVSMNGAL
jgi:hypothetical protein